MLAPWLDLNGTKGLFEKVWHDPDTGETRTYAEIPPGAEIGSYSMTFERDGRLLVAQFFIRPHQQEKGAVSDDTKRRVYLGMGDKITCKAVLRTPEKEEGRGHLFLDTVDSDFREIPVRPKGAPHGADGPEWEYEIGDDGKIHMQPSLLCPDSGFHTDFQWTCDFVRCQPGEHILDVFLRENPGRSWAREV